MSRAKIAIVLWLVACVASGLVVINGGFAGRFDAADQQLLRSMDKFEYYGIYQRGTCFSDQGQPVEEYPEAECIDDGPGTSVLIVGDSFAAHYFPGMTETLDGSGYTLSQATKASCSYLVPVDELTPSCKDFRQYVLSDLIPRMKPDLIIYSELWRRTEAEPGLSDRMATAISAFGETGSRVVVAGPTPGFFAAVPKTLVISGIDATGGGDVWFPCMDDGAIWDALVAAADSPRVQLVEMDATTQRASGGSPTGLSCLAATDEGPLHWDHGHMTQAGSEFYSDYLWSRISPK